MNHILKIKKLNENAVVPAQATAGSAGMDLSSCLDNDVIIAPGEIKLIPTGLAAAPDTDQCLSPLGSCVKTRHFTCQLRRRS